MTTTVTPTDHFHNTFFGTGGLSMGSASGVRLGVVNVTSSEDDAI